MRNNKHHFYFAIALVTIFSVYGFVMLEVFNTMTNLALIEGSLYGVVRSGEARLSAEINRGIEEVDLDALEGEFEDIDSEIDSL